MNFNQTLTQIDYKNVLTYFSEVSSIPRGSGNNKKISDFLCQKAKELGLSHVQDEALNVIIYKDASPGYESLPALIFQGHMDMVCVKEEDCTHDFETEGVKLLLDGDYIRAESTTLGADDGIALAYMLALLSDDKVSHPPLCMVITTDEETGMDGAKALDASLLRGSMMINVDSEDEDVVLVSCAGGLTVHGEVPLKRVKAEGTVVKVNIGGLLGGHSGIEIHKSRCNAVYLMARLFMELKQDLPFDLISFVGGDKDNAIPSSSKALLLAEDEVKANELTEKITKFSERYQKELSSSEPGLTIASEIGKRDSYEILHPVSFEKMLFVLIHSPNGVQVMSSHLEGLVESSLNLGIFFTEEERATYHYSIRSSIKSYKHYLRDRLSYLFEFLGGSTEAVSEYPAWEYKTESVLREILSKAYVEEYGHEPRFEAIHAGLECGIISEKKPEIDIVSIGPKMYDIHSPKERLSVSSVIRQYKFLEKLLAQMKNI